MAPDAFPQFRAGDVEIYFRDVKEPFVLHSYVLALHSPWFKSCLSTRWDTDNNPTVVDGKKRWKFELKLEDDPEMNMFARVNKTPTATAIDLTKIGTRSASKDKTGKESTKMKHDCVTEAHQDLLGTLYHKIPDFVSKEIGEAKPAVEELARVAKIYGCEAVVRGHIEQHLYHRDPEIRDDWNILTILELGNDLKSPMLFIVAANSIIRHNKKSYKDVMNGMKIPGIKVLLDEKRKELGNLYKACQYDLLTMDIREKYETMPEIAHAFFEDWLCNRLESGEGSGFSKCCTDFFDIISRSDFDICRDPMDREALEEFYERLGMDSCKIDLFDASSCIDLVFEKAAKLAKPATDDRANHRKCGGRPSPDQNFIGITESDLPWVKK